MIAGTAPVREEPRPVTFGLILYNIVYWPYLLGTCAVLFVPALLIFIVTAPFDRKRRALHAFTCVWGAHYLAWAPFAGVNVEGKGPDGPCIFVSNHQSMVDILAVFATRLSFLWVSKVENFYVPFLGWNMWLNGYVPLKRGHLPSIMRMVRTCHRRLRDGHNLFVFPEGTRSPNGDLIRFYPGAFRLAVRFQVPVVPVVIEGTRDILAKGRLLIRPRPVTIRVLPAIYPSDTGNDHKELLSVTRDRMQKALAEIRAA